MDSDRLYNIIGRKRNGSEVSVVHDYSKVREILTAVYSDPNFDEPMSQLNAEKTADNLIAIADNGTIATDCFHTGEALTLQRVYWTEEAGTFEA